jgi:serine phosphatase RsbU (regulator of sigma subunit)
MSRVIQEQPEDKRIRKLTFWVLFQRIAGQFPLKLVFSLPFILQFLLVTCLIGVLLFQGGQEAVGAVMKEMRGEVLERVQEQLSRHMREPLRLNNLNVDAWHAGLLDLSDPVLRERQFVNHLQAFPDASMTFIGLSNGGFYGARRKASGEIQVVRNDRETGGASWYYAISKQGDGVERQEVFPNFDARTRPWYQAAKESGKPVFSGVYRHFVFHEPTITAAYPIFDEDGKLIGVFGVDYLLSWLGEMLRSLSLGPSGQVFVVDKNDMIVAASVLKEPFEVKEGKAERILAVDCNDPVLQMAVKSFLGHAKSAYGFKLNDKSYSVSVESFQEHGITWNIYVVLADEDFMGGIWQAIHKTAIIVFIITIAVFFLAVWTAGWVTHPILRLNVAARELAKGRLYPVLDTERKDELGELSRSFNMMATQTIDLVSNLEARVIERTQNLAEKTQEEQYMRETFYGELAKAGRQQRAMLPENIKDDSRLRLEILYEPYMLVSGDSCGYRWLSDGSLFGYIIDVTGHGAASALQTAAVSLMLQDIIDSSLSLSERMSELNRRVNAYFSDEVMVAAFCCELDFKKHELRYVAAGITEFFADSAGAQGRIKTPGLFLGVSEAPDYDVCSLPIKKGDCFCFYSDGIADRLKEESQLLLGIGFENLIATVGKIGADGVRWDDVTVVCIEIGDLA